MPLKEIQKRAAFILGTRLTASFIIGKDENQILLGVGHSLASNVSKVYLMTGGEGAGRILWLMRFERGR